MQYDTVALLAAIPSLRAKYFDAVRLPPLVNAGGPRAVIGISEKSTQIKKAPSFVEMMSQGFQNGLRLNHQAKSLTILCLQLRSDKLADTIIACVLLRSFWDLGLSSCMALLLSVDHAEVKTTEGAAAEAGAAIVAIRQTLADVGLSHVKLHVISNVERCKDDSTWLEGQCADIKVEDASSVLHELYQRAPPVGVTLVVDSPLTHIWKFAQQHMQLFRNKTVRVVHNGGALVVAATEGWASDRAGKAESAEAEPTGEMLVAPDPAAQNHRLDLDAAKQFYRMTQCLSVPLVILSRHIVKACRLPKALFDVLELHGGPVGGMIASRQKASMVDLWHRARAEVGDPARRDLPPRCDVDWFQKTFCGGKSTLTEDIWSAVVSVNLFSPIALIAALPGDTMDNYLHAMYVTVRSTNHAVIGLTDSSRNVKNAQELRSLLVQCIFSASLVNQSKHARQNQTAAWRGRPPPRPPPATQSRIAARHSVATSIAGLPMILQALSLSHLRMMRVLMATRALQAGRSRTVSAAACSIGPSVKPARTCSAGKTPAPY